MMREFQLRRKRKEEESADETRRVEAALSPPSVWSPPQTHIRWEAVRGEDEAAEEAGQSAAEKPALLEVMEISPASPSSPPPGNPGWVLFPAGRDPVLLEAGCTE